MSAERMVVYRRRDSRLARSARLTYAEYLKTPLWRELRKKVLLRDNHKCIACGRSAYCVHHTKYSSNVLFATEPTPSLISLCNSCHEFIERNADGSKTSADHALKKLRCLCRKNGRHLPGRCTDCMMGGGSKDDGLCKHCRRRKSRLSGIQPKFGNQIWQSHVPRERTRGVVVDPEYASVSSKSRQNEALSIPVGSNPVTAD